MILGRIFVPSWRFFDRVGARPRLLTQDARGEWHPLFVPPRRRWWRIIFNPGGNLHHANQNLTQRLLDEVVLYDDLSRCVTYRIVAGLARARGARKFKLTADGEDILISAALS